MSPSFQECFICSKCFNLRYMGGFRPFWALTRTGSLCDSCLCTQLSQEWNIGQGAGLSLPSGASLLSSEPCWILCLKIWRPCILHEMFKFLRLYSFTTPQRQVLYFKLHCTYLTASFTTYFYFYHSLPVQWKPWVLIQWYPCIRWWLQIWMFVINWRLFLCGSPKIRKQGCFSDNNNKNVS